MVHLRHADYGAPSGKVKDPTGAISCRLLHLRTKMGRTDTERVSCSHADVGNPTGGMPMNKAFCGKPEEEKRQRWIKKREVIEFGLF
ncbi:hypothetical protein TcasGA2_TC009751 [Tribolium castaneum]|uniref:Uncharacterized protein n=1 Tax=Tribolium castaneum TaxID=7070 RepID=D6WPG9_TRICA|nr:hypothetical protein TcasGA2_TC009751 [Tribolium castaneum]